MNNHQLIKFLGEHPKHPIHRVPVTQLFNRWRTLTWQDPGGREVNFIQFRQNLLDRLYEDWEDYRHQTIEKQT